MQCTAGCLLLKTNHRAGAQHTGYAHRQKCAAALQKNTRGARCRPSRSACPRSMVSHAPTAAHRTRNAAHIRPVSTCHMHKLQEREGVCLGVGMCARTATTSTHTHSPAACIGSNGAGHFHRESNSICDGLAAASLSITSVQQPPVRGCQWERGTRRPIAAAAKMYI